MKALTIWQPWASLIMIGAKPYEFRGWMAPRSIVGGELVIHAGKRAMKGVEVKDLIDRLSNPDEAWSTGLIADIALPFLQSLKAADQLPLAAGLGTARIGASKEGAIIAAQMGGPAINDSDREQHSQWGWPLSEIKPWDTPVPMNGKQGLWDWPTPEGMAL